jgi:hypothetical protein
MAFGLGDGCVGCRGGRRRRGKEGVGTGTMGVEERDGGGRWRRMKAEEEWTKERWKEGIRGR